LHFIKRLDLELPKTTGKLARKKIVLIPPEHIVQLRSHFYNKDIRLGLIFDLSYYGALRREEVVSIKLSDFNLEELANNPNKEARLLLTKTKFSKQRYVILPKLLIKAIVMYSREKGLSQHEKIFKLGKRAWWEYFYDACVKLGFTKMQGEKLLPLYHLHSIRHTRSSEWWESGIDIVRIQSRLGHSDISTTRRYITPDEKKEEQEWGKEYG
jgi:integrase